MLVRTLFVQWIQENIPHVHNAVQPLIYLLRFRLSWRIVFTLRPVWLLQWCHGFPRLLRHHLQQIDCLDRGSLQKHLGHGLLFKGRQHLGSSLLQNWWSQWYRWFVVGSQNLDEWSNEKGNSISRCGGCKLYHLTKVVVSGIDLLTVKVINCLFLEFQHGGVLGIQQAQPLFSDFENLENPGQ